MKVGNGVLNSKTQKSIGLEAPLLAEWFQGQARPLPWRHSQDPYRIWISEIMLQQTTVTAVLPFYDRFMKTFPTVQSLAKAPIEKVYECWAGLGYYSRARNLHKAAQQLANQGFAKSYSDLLQLPGFGDYTARAVSSQAFNEAVGVVDGNVIRFLSRRWGTPWAHWQSQAKKELQALSDQYATKAEPRLINQALMEMGATICTPQNPSCFLCPVKKNCVARLEDQIENLPLKKPRRESEIWLWNATVVERHGQLAFIENDYAPFLKKQLILPGNIQRSSKPPSKFDFQHAITHHKIYVTVNRLKSKFSKAEEKAFVWINAKQLKEKVPFALIQKAVALSLAEKR